MTATEPVSTAIATLAIELFEERSNLCKRQFRKISEVLYDDDSFVEEGWLSIALDNKVLRETVAPD